MPFPPYFNRRDICEAHYVLEMDYGVGGILWERPRNLRRMAGSRAQMARLPFRPRPEICARGYDALTENGKRIYDTLKQRYQLPVFEKVFRVMQIERMMRLARHS